eukprot:442619_1
MSLFVDAARAKEFECVICYEIYKEPVQIGCQEHVFCKQCIDELISKQGRSFHCPLCRTKCTAKTVTRVKFIDRQIGDLKVKCPNAASISVEKSICIENQNDNEQNDNSIRSSTRYSLRRSTRLKTKATENIDNNISNKHCGQKRQRAFTNENVNPNKKRKLNKNESSKICEWQGQYSDLNNHIKICPLQLITCKYCSISMLQSDLENHFEKCPKFPMKCIRCKQTKICRNKMETHIDEYCPMTLINCRQCKQKMKRQETRLHIRNKCPESLIKCTFYEFGCKEKLKRKNEKKHVENAAFTHNHLVQIANHQKKLNKRIEKVENELKLLKRNVNKSKDQYLFVGQRVQAVDHRYSTHKFIDATIKIIHPTGVTVSWVNTRWKDPKWDLFISKLDYNKYIKTD